jgi:hypothetical protein
MKLLKLENGHHQQKPITRHALTRREAIEIDDFCVNPITKSPRKNGPKKITRRYFFPRKLYTIALSITNTLKIINAYIEAGMGADQQCNISGNKPGK